MDHIFDPRSQRVALDNASAADIEITNQRLRANARRASEMAKGRFAKAGEVGYQTPEVTAGGDNGSYSPLVAQSIDTTYTTLSYSAEDLSLFKMIPRGKAVQTVHQYMVNVSHGQRLNIFIQESGVAGTGNAKWRRESLRLKFMAAKRQVSDVASAVGLVAGSNVLAIETQEAVLHLLGEMERTIAFGDSSVNPLSFDGILKQLEDKAPGNIVDLNGATPTLDNISDMLYKYNADPYYAKTDGIFVEPKIFGALNRQNRAAGRHDNAQPIPGAYVGVPHIAVMGPKGYVPIYMAPFLNNRRPLPLNADGDDFRDTGEGELADIPAVPALDVQPAAAFNAASQFDAAHEGIYTYWIEAIGEKGNSIILESDPVTVSIDDRVSLTIKGDGLTAPKPLFHRVYRSSVDGDYSTAVMLFEVNYVDGVDTVVIDDNAVLENTSPILGLQLTGDVLQYVKLMDMIRRPLAQVVSAVPWQVMTFGGLAMKAASKCWALTNAASDDTFAV